MPMPLQGQENTKPVLHKSAARSRRVPSTRLTSCGSASCSPRFTARSPPAPSPPTSSRTPKTDNEIRCHYYPKAITSALSTTREKHQRPSEASPLTAEVELTLGAEVCGRGQHKYAAPCAGLSLIHISEPTRPY